MAKDTKNAIYIDDVEYDFESLTDYQKQCVQHVADLDRKIGSTDFQRAQLQVGRDAFMGMLKQSLEAPTATTEE